MEQTCLVVVLYWSAPQIVPSTVVATVVYYLFTYINKHINRYHMSLYHLGTLFEEHVCYNKNISTITEH